MTQSSTEINQTRIIESITTGSRSPEEILAKLDSLDLEWYITEEGTLMIKSWQVAAEQFVAAGRVAELRTKTRAPSGAESLEWVSKHLADLRVAYGGKWIAVAGNQVIASADDLPALMEGLDQVDVEGPFVTQIPAEDVLWHTLYAQ